MFAVALQKRVAYTPRPISFTAWFLCEAKTLPAACSPFRRLHMQINFTAHVFPLSRRARALKTTTNMRSSVTQNHCQVGERREEGLFLFLKDESRGRLSFVSCVFEVCVHRFSSFFIMAELHSLERKIKLNSVRANSSWITKISYKILVFEEEKL